jgi:hypothetical protein
VAVGRRLEADADERARAVLDHGVVRRPLAAAPRRGPGRLPTDPDALRRAVVDGFGGPGTSPAVDRETEVMGLLMLHG